MVVLSLKLAFLEDLFQTQNGDVPQVPSWASQKETLPWLGVKQCEKVEECCPLCFYLDWISEVCFGLYIYMIMVWFVKCLITVVTMFHYVQVQYMDIACKINTGLWWSWVCLFFFRWWSLDKKDSSAPKHKCGMFLPQPQTNKNP